jgi:hypothetical protein
VSVPFDGLFILAITNSGSKLRAKCATQMPKHMCSEVENAPQLRLTEVVANCGTMGHFPLDLLIQGVKINRRYVHLADMSEVIRADRNDSSFYFL